MSQAPAIVRHTSGDRPAAGEVRIAACQYGVTTDVEANLATAMRMIDLLNTMSGSEQNEELVQEYAYSTLNYLHIQGMIAPPCQHIEWERTYLLDIGIHHHHIQTIHPLLLFLHQNH